MYKTLTNYNDKNNTPLLNEKIREAIHKVIEEESMSDANNLSAETFKPTPCENKRVWQTQEKNTIRKCIRL